MEALSLQLLYNAAALAGAYGLLGLGFALTLRAAGAINFAHGDAAVAAAYAAIAASSLGLTGGWTLPLAVLAGGAGGLLIAGVVWAPLRKRPIEATFIAAIAVGMIAQNGLLAGFGGAPQAIQSFDAGGLKLAQLFLSYQSIATIGLAVTAFIGVALVLTGTQLGRRLRAAAEDREIAAAHGLPVMALALGAFVAAGMLAGLAGVLLANQHFALPNNGADYILKAYIAATLAGWGRILPTALAAFLIAMFETVGAALFSHAVAEGALYVAFILILAVRPEGFAGETAGRRA